MKNHSKIYLSLFLVLVMLGSMVVFSTANVTAENTKTLLFSVPIGEEIDELRIDNSLASVAWGYKGPESFLILSDGNVAILDSVNKRIVTYDKNGLYLSNINLQCDENDIPVLMANKESEYCVLVKQHDETGYRETNGYYALFVTESNTIRIALNFDVTQNDNIIVSASYNDDGSVTVMTNRSDYINIAKTGAYITKSYQHDLSGINKEYTDQNGNSILFSVDENVHEMRFVKRKYNGNIITTQLQYTNGNCYVFLIIEYSLDGTILSYSIIDDWNNNFTVPHAQVSLDKDGQVYYMEVTEQAVNIYLLRLDSNNEHLTQIDLNQTIDNNALTNMERSANSTETAYVTINRQTVYSRAKAMAELSWTVTAQNKTERTGVTIPSYVDNAEIGDVLQGIPYCWGGYNGYENVTYTSSSGSQKTAYAFSNIVTSSSNVTAGNVNTDTNGHQTGTIGLDCSGFVTSAYKLDTNKKNAAFFTSYNPVSSIYELKQMDCIVNSGYHIVLFDCFAGTSSSSTSQMYIYDSSVNAGKVARRLVNISSYQTSGWVYRTPWVTCSYSDGYNMVSHYQICADCGHKKNVENHTFVSYGVKYRCSVCGYITTHIADTTALNDSSQGK